MSAVLEPATGDGVGGLAPPPPVAANKELDRLETFSKLSSADDEKTRVLLEKYKAKSIHGKVTGVLPVNVSFPAFGPSIFLVSELTSENQFPAAEFSFQRDKKGGVR